MYIIPRKVRFPNSKRNNEVLPFSKLKYPFSLLETEIEKNIDFIIFLYLQDKLLLATLHINNFLKTNPIF